MIPRNPSFGPFGQLSRISRQKLVTMMQQNVEVLQKSGETDIKWIIHTNSFNNYTITSNSFNIVRATNVEWYLKYSTHNYMQDSYSGESRYYSSLKLLNSHDNKCEFENQMKIKVVFGYPPKAKYFVEITKSLSFLECVISEGKINELSSPDGTLEVRLNVKPLNSVDKSPAKFQSFLFNTALSDVIFQIGNEKFPAHKIMLSSASPVFEKMFSHQMKENITNTVELKETDPDVFKELLSFIYTGEIKNLEIIAFGLYELAKMYDISELQLICENFLQESLTVDNAVSVLELADRHNSEILKKVGIKYINDHFSEIGKTEAFNNMKKEILLDFIFAKFNVPRASM